MEYKDISVMSVKKDLDQNDEIDSKKNSGMNTPEENKHLKSWEKNTKEVMCGYANSLMNMK